MNSTRNDLARSIISALTMFDRGTTAPDVAAGVARSLAIADAIIAAINALPGGSVDPLAVTSGAAAVSIAEYIRDPAPIPTAALASLCIQWAIELQSQSPESAAGTIPNVLTTDAITPMQLFSLDVPQSTMVTALVRIEAVVTVGADLQKILSYDDTFCFKRIGGGILNVPPFGVAPQVPIAPLQACTPNNQGGFFDETTAVNVCGFNDVNSQAVVFVAGEAGNTLRWNATILNVSSQSTAP